jgi:hypothetical protein
MICCHRSPSFVAIFVAATVKERLNMGSWLKMKCRIFFPRSLYSQQQKKKERL